MSSKNRGANRTPAVGKRVNRSPRSTFCRPELLQILSPCVCTVCLPPPPATADHPPPASCVPSPRHTGREDLEQFPTTESLAWASVINSYSLELADHPVWSQPKILYVIPFMKTKIISTAGKCFWFRGVFRSTGDLTAATDQLRIFVNRLLNELYFIEIRPE